MLFFRTLYIFRGCMKMEILSSLFNGATKAIGFGLKNSPKILGTAGTIISLGNGAYTVAKEVKKIYDEYKKY